MERKETRKKIWFHGWMPRNLWNVCQAPIFYLLDLSVPRNVYITLFYLGDLNNVQQIFHELGCTNITVCLKNQILSHILGGYLFKDTQVRSIAN